MKNLLCILLATLFLIAVAVSCSDNKADEQATSSSTETAATSDETTTAEESSSMHAESTSKAESAETTTIAENTSESAVTEAVTTVPPETKPAEVTLSETKPVVTQAPVTEPAETTPPALVIPESGASLGNTSYDDPFNMTAFSSVAELYEYLKNMPDNEFKKILSQEQYYLWDTVQTIHVSKDELQHGIFGYFRNSILTSGAVIVPHFNGLPMELGEGRSIELETADSYRKTRIVYPTEQKITFHIMKYDPELVPEAIEKGASWLIYQLNSEQTNLHNYEQFIDNMVSQGIMSVKDMTVYVKEYILGDRTVKALVYDNSKAKLGAGRCIEIYFVYDDLLVHTLGQPEDIGDIFTGLTFEEVKVDV